MSKINENNLIPNSWIGEILAIVRNDTQKAKDIFWYILTYGSTQGAAPQSTGDPMLDGVAMSYCFQLQRMKDNSEKVRSSLSGEQKSEQEEIYRLAQEGKKARDIFIELYGADELEELGKDEQKELIKKMIYNKSGWKKWSNEKKSEKV